MADEKPKDISIDDILENIHPDKISKKISIPHRMAREKYTLKDLSAKNYTDFRKQLIKYAQHHVKEVDGHEISEERAWAEATKFLKDRNGNLDVEGHYKEALQGGLGEIITKISKGIEQEHIRHYTNHQMDVIDPMDFDAKTTLIKQYQSKYKSILPEDFKLKKPEELAQNYKGVIESHAQLAYGIQEQMGAYKKPKPKK